MRKVFCLISVSFLVIATFGQSGKEEQVWQRVEALTRAVFETKDSAALWDLVSEKVTYGHSGGNVEDKPTMVSKAVSNPLTYKNRSLERVSITFANKTAIVRHNFRAISIENGKETLLDLGILQVWGKEGRKWRLLARQAVRIPPKT